uniref:Uncharacterized protein n=1 Tax=Arundo donax TaxID=35708 RepID=A0A0A9B7A9_ARUDO
MLLSLLDMPRKISTSA